MGWTTTLDTVMARVHVEFIVLWRATMHPHETPNCVWPVCLTAHVVATDLQNMCLDAHFHESTGRGGSVDSSPGSRQPVRASRQLRPRAERAKKIFD